MVKQGMEYHVRLIYDQRPLGGVQVSSAPATATFLTLTLNSILWCLRAINYLVTVPSFLPADICYGSYRGSSFTSFRFCQDPSSFEVTEQSVAYTCLGGFVVVVSDSLFCF